MRDSRGRLKGLVGEHPFGCLAARRATVVLVVKPAVSFAQLLLDALSDAARILTGMNSSSIAGARTSPRTLLLPIPR